MTMGLMRGSADGKRTMSDTVWGGGGGGRAGMPWEGMGPPRRPQRRLLSVTNAIEAGTCRQEDSGWA